jgi:hypothetical protein
MRKLFFIAAVIFISWPLMAQEDESASEVVVETRQLAPFENLRITRGINVTLVEGEAPKAEIHIKNAPIDDVLLEQSNKDLTIRMRARIYKDVAVNVYLYYQNINEITVSSGASVYSDDVLETNFLKLETGTDASIQLEIEVNKLEASASASRIELMGSAQSIDLNASTGGRFLGANLESKTASIRTNTGARAQVWVTEKLDARAGSGARVEYTGNPPKVEVHTSLGGKVEKIE